MKKVYIILLAVILAVAALCIWQRNNIKALYIFLTYDKAEIEQMIEDNKKELDEKIKEYSEYVPRPLTPEEEAKIASGEMTWEEAAEMLVAETEKESTGETLATESEAEKIEPDNSETTIKPEDETAPETEQVPGETTTGGNITGKPLSGNATSSGTDSGTTSKKSEGEIIRSYTAKFYSLKAYYIGRLSAIESDARKEYSAMSKEEKKNLSKTAFVNKYMGYATGYQNECDAEVAALLKSMKDELKAVGGDTAVIDVIKQAYENEKAARKAYYMNMVS